MKRKKQIVKTLSNKDAEFRGRIDERTKDIMNAVNDLKEHDIRFEEKVDKKFDALDACIQKKIESINTGMDCKFKEFNESIDKKFQGHNDYHQKLERKYTKFFIVLAALTIGGLVSNPSGVVYIASKVVIVLKFFVNLL